MLYRSLLIFAVLLPGVVSSATPVLALPTPTPDQIALQTVLNKLDAAEKRKDATAWGALLKANATHDFTMNMQGHSPANVSQTISNERSFLTTMESISRDVEKITNFDVLGNLASVDATADEIAYIKDDAGELGKPGKVHKFEIVSHEVFALTSTNGAWKIQSITVTPKTVSVDGYTKQVSSSAG